MAVHQYNFPTRIHFGPGAIELLPGVLADAGRKRPLVVTDRGLAALPLVPDVMGSLSAAKLEPAVFSGVWGNPVKSQVKAGVDAFHKHTADSVVGLGGGAALDVAKAIALMAHHPGDLFDYEDEKPGARPINREIPYFVTIPTTAGTGSEVGRSTVISDDETHAKKIIFSPRLLAARVLADPNVTAGLPAAVTAATGMDALTHLVESYLAKGVQPLCDGIATEGLRLLARGLRPAVDFARRIEKGETELLGAPEHLEARARMLNAALMGGVAFQKGLGVTHSLAHALSTVCDLHHGLANGIAIPYAMEFNRETVSERLADLAVTVKAADPSAAGFITWLRELRAAVGIPDTLAAAGVRGEHLDRLTEVALADGCHANNPRPVGAADFRALFQAALGT
jgi:alcohol dehydrogenase class IV